ncbi:MAG: ferritin-like domain-containing protein [Alysiella sp.]|uniref:ferritin-like domain-containing protein n=1 Tax=Alysiella sp. TaxID=1872483 RepID=UPI0026DC4D96|nr:ferritin-like domain-containing protein [Alysiella sp.]MDO4433749.1 ferritin-like domain-containing protein [Alysiella sp.]
MEKLADLLLQALCETQPTLKADQTRQLHYAWLSGSLNIKGFGITNKSQPQPQVPDIHIAGRPNQPKLVAPHQVQQRKLGTNKGYAAMLHAICHIEFNAINLALDAAHRFRTLPLQFTGDWLRVAAEEAEHFTLMRQRLQAHGYDYGDFPAHGNLWDMAYKTAFDPLLRMALVPRVLEARGLDVTPAIKEKVQQRGDTTTCEVLDIIYRDEVGHVQIGTHWYTYLCHERGLEPMALFRKLLRQYDMFIFRGYVNLEARERAGFSAFEMAMLADFEHAIQKAT